MESYNYWVPLVKLDDKLAIFHDDRNGVTFSLPFANWVKIGRPGAFNISPIPAPA